MRDVPADEARVGFYRPKSEPASREDPSIGIIHFLIADLGAGLIDVKAIGILHDEFPPSHEPESRADLISKFGLDLVEIERKLTIGTHFSPEEIGNDFFMSRAQAKIPLVPILEA